MSTSPAVTYAQIIHFCEGLENKRDEGLPIPKLGFYPGSIRASLDLITLLGPEEQKELKSRLLNLLIDFTALYRATLSTT